MALEPHSAFWDQTTNLLISGRPTLPSEPQPPITEKNSLTFCKLKCATYIYDAHLVPFPDQTSVVVASLQSSSANNGFHIQKRKSVERK